MRRRRLVACAMACIIGATILGGCGDSDKTDKKDDNSTEAVDVMADYVPPVIPEAKQQVYDFGLADNSKDGAILQAFCWSFATITESMADIAAAGYSAIQTSPINAVYDNDAGMQLMGDGKWYYNYQPTDFTIGNYQLGSKDEFIKMCDEADKYGIKIIVDVAPNHTAFDTASVSKNLIEAVGGEDKLYHKNGFTNITNYSDRFSCTSGSLGGLPDIDTENPLYQKYIVEYLNECIKCGADGFRFDAAKHIGLIDDPGEDESECNFWEVVLSNLANKDKLFNYGEVLQGDNERIGEYIKTIGAATASNFGSRVRGAMISGKVNADNLTDYKCGNSTDVVLWVESHDNYINDGSGESISNRDVELAWALVAARGTGTPLFFARPYGSDKDNIWGPLNEIGAAGDYIYKSPTVSAVNHFRNAMIGEDEKLFNPSDNKSLLIIERGTKGLVLVNVADEYAIEEKVALADGTYIDRVDKKTEYIVKDGMLTGKVPASTTVVLYNDGYTNIEAMPIVSADANEYYAMEHSTVDVTLHVSGAAEGIYVIGSQTGTYKDGDVITVGADMKAGDSLKLTVKAANTSGFSSAMSYTFTKEVAAQEVVIEHPMTVYFEKPENWKDTIYTYIYMDSSDGLKILKEWPGLKMKKESDGRYSFTFEDLWETGYIMFSDGKNQYPGSGESGELVEADMTYTVK